MKPEIQGNLQGLKQHTLLELQDLYNLSTERNELLSPEILDRLVTLSTAISREIALYLNRKGQVVNIAVGDSSTVSLPEVKGRKSVQHLCGIRCIHTHPSGEARLSWLDLTSLANLRLDCMAAIGISEGNPTGVQVAYLQPLSGMLSKQVVIFDLQLKEVETHPFATLVSLIDRQVVTKLTVTSESKERAILVAVEGKPEDLSAEDSLAELAELARTAGADVVAKVVQKRPRPDPATFIGRGKAKELVMFLQETDANCMIFDEELTPSQSRNLEMLFNCKVLDRTGLILDIFASRAKTREGKVQVELAQLKYLLPRLTGLGTALSRLGGGIGTRGPGETKLETDRRHIRRRIAELDEELIKIKQHRSLQRISQKAVTIPRVSLVGYTNAGKSSLLNALTEAETLAEDKLFATLDPLTRRVSLPNNREIVITDTVGFIRKLPHHLVAAFRATLEEVVQADLLIHVVDASSQILTAQIMAVDKVLEDLGAAQKPIIMAFNKIDKLDMNTELSGTWPNFPHSVSISALTGKGLPELIALLDVLLPRSTSVLSAILPYNRGDILALLHQEGEVKQVEYLPDGVKVIAGVAPRLASLLQPYVIS